MKGHRRVVIGSAVAGLLGSAAIFAVNVLVPEPANSQLAEEGVNDLGKKKYWIFIYSKKDIGNGKWRFQTKTIGEGLSKPRFSSWQEADCWNSTIDGKLIGAVKIRPGGRGGGFSNAGILQTVCGVGKCAN